MQKEKKAQEEKAAQADRHRVSAESTGGAGAFADDHTYGVRLPLYI